MKKPTQCVLWKNSGLVADRKEARFERIESYVDDSHLMRSRLRCRECGQLYFFEFHEVVDWARGNDAQYSTYIAVENDKEIELLKQEATVGLLKHFPRLQRDFPSDA